MWCVSIPTSRKRGRPVFCVYHWGSSMGILSRKLGGSNGRANKQDKFATILQEKGGGTRMILMTKG